MHSKIKTLVISSLVLAPALLIWAIGNQPTIHLCGDSTMADKPLDDNPERGWGQLLPLFFRRDIQIINYARNGRSTKSFINEGLWARVVSNLKPGDYVLIQFGHNDAKISDTTRYAEAHTTYRTNLIKFIEESRQHGANPILITPVNRRKFSDDGRFIDQHGDYPAVVRELAATFEVPLLDLHARSRELLEQLGPEKSEALFLRAEPGVYKAYPTGKSDNTHFCREGAIAVAQLVIAELQRIKSPLVQFLSEVPEFSAVGAGKIVGLDYHFYQRQQLETPDGRRLPVGYTWEDRSDSGLYELGNLFENQGAFIAEVQQPPTAAILQQLSIYILPIDCCHEQPQNSMSLEIIDSIITWVKAGGVLVAIPIAPNVAGQYEALLTEFGIRCKPVAKNKFEPEIIKKLPAHPLFTGISAWRWPYPVVLELKQPAEPLLRTKHGTIMAAAEVGQGLVFVSAAPWFKNAYFYQDISSAESESWIGGQNLCSWLLSQASPVR